MNSKPAGVDLLVIFAVIGGVFDVLGGVLLIVVMSASISWFGNLVGSRIVSAAFLILSIISCLLLITGALSLFLAYGLWKGRGWAWTSALTSAVIGLAGSILLLGIGIGLVGVASNGLAIYYLTRIEVKAFFGKAPRPESQSFPNVSQRFCTHCGNRLNGKEAYCPTCGSKQNSASV
jgi:uncharacterized membrane protein (DUF2068 family)